MINASMASTGNGRIGRAQTSVGHLSFLARLLAPRGEVPTITVAQSPFTIGVYVRVLHTPTSAHGHPFVRLDSADQMQHA